MPLSVRFPRYRGRVWRSGPWGLPYPPLKERYRVQSSLRGTINDGEPVLPLAGRCKASSSSADPRSGRLAHGGTIAGGKDLQLPDGPRDEGAARWLCDREGNSVVEHSWCSLVDFRWSTTSFWWQAGHWSRVVPERKIQLSALDITSGRTESSTGKGVDRALDPGGLACQSRWAPRLTQSAGARTGA